MSFSRVAKRPLLLPVGVKVDLHPTKVVVQGKFGVSEMLIPEGVSVMRSGETLLVSSEPNKIAKSLSGTVRALLGNFVQGVSTKFTRKLLLVGVGYRAQVKANVLQLSVGYSSPVDYTLPEGVSVEVVNNTEIVLSSHDKAVLGKSASEIRSIRSPEPYKGKGIRYSNEVVSLKEVKKK
jgi:large subunit ribosomal protein L6